MQRQQAQGRTRAGLFLVGSLFLAVLAAGLVFRVVRNEQSKAAALSKPGQTVDVVVALRDLYMGLPIGTDDVELRQLTAGSVPEDETFDSLDNVVGRTPRSLILASEPVNERRLADPAAGIGLNAVVPPGKRAMTVATDTEDAVAGLLQPGNYVDIIVTIKPEEGSFDTKWATSTILQKIRVLAVGGSLAQVSVEEQQKRMVSNKPTTDDKAGADKAGADEATDKKEKKGRGTSQQDVMRRMKPSITLEVSPEEAEKLALAVAQGEIHVVLRSDMDVLGYNSHGPLTSKTLIGNPVAEVVPDPMPRRADPVPTVEENVLPSAQVIQGSQQIDVKFNADGTQAQTPEKRKKNK